jgi:hypothetical protein
MLRLTHTQVATGGLLINDIDDGLPNKTAKRGVGDPKTYQRDGYANAPKQPCYVPRAKLTDATVAGYIDLVETDRVLLSQQKGTIAGFVRAGLLTVTSFASTVLAAPVLTSATLDTPGAGDLTIVGTGLTSLAPEITTVILTGDIELTLTQAQIVSGGGSVGATSIVIPAALIPGAAATTTSAQVRADAQLSAVSALV